MAHGVTLEMRAIKKPEPQLVHRSTGLPYINLARDQKRLCNRKSQRLTTAAFWAAVDVVVQQAAAA